MEKRINKILAFGCMRLPMTKGIVGEDGVVDNIEFSKMIDAFMKAGFNYFDTAHGYLNGKSELAIRDCLSSRYDRESYYLTDKLTYNFFNTKEECYKVFEEQLKDCGVTYFDNYYIHAVNSDNIIKYEKCECFEVLKDLKQKGKIHHIGFSFHDSPKLLEEILIKHPEAEFVQIQFNYLDYDDPSIQSYECYKVCEKYNKKVTIMEPLKGSNLVNLPPEADKVFRDLGGDYSNAGYGLRFAGSFKNVVAVLSGMSRMSDMEDNIKTMNDFKPLTKEEFEATTKVRNILNGLGVIKCTACHYCAAGCPKQIPIPEIFACYNNKIRYQKDFSADFYYGRTTAGRGKASDCIKCGHCEKVCPQHLKIRDYLVTATQTFEKK